MRGIMLIYILVMVLTASCGQESQPDLKDALIGKWMATSMYVKMAPKKKGMPVEIMEINAENWEEKLSLKPTVHYFMKNGSYKEEYIDLKDSLVFKPSGYWAVYDDTLVLNQDLPEKQTLKFAIAIKGGDGVLVSIQDFNGDGVMDSLKTTLLKHPDQR